MILKIIRMTLILSLSIMILVSIFYKGNKLRYNPEIKQIQHNLKGKIGQGSDGKGR